MITVRKLAQSLSFQRIETQRQSYNLMVSKQVGNHIFQNYQCNCIAAEAGGIIEVPTEDLEGLSSLRKNHRAIVGMLRKGVELMHGAIKQDKLLRNVSRHEFLGTIGQKMARAYKYSIKDHFYLSTNETFLDSRFDAEYASMNKMTLLYANSVDAFNLSHKKFNNLADEELQRTIIQLALRRLNCPNPLDSGDASLRFFINHVKETNKSSFRLASTI